MAVNLMTLQGRLVADPEIRTTPNGKSVCSFCIAWSEQRGGYENRIFLNCTAWGKTGEMIAQWFTKGKEIIVQGPLYQREWQTKDGTSRKSIDMTVEKVHFCGPKGDTGGGYATQNSGYSDAGQAPNGASPRATQQGMNTNEMSDLGFTEYNDDLPF